jgi:cytoskeletal protein CcmA (bactofilin family)
MSGRCRQISLGLRSGESSLVVHGTMNHSSFVRISDGDLAITNGDMILGHANIVTDGDLSVAGDVFFGDNHTDSLQVKAHVTMKNSTDGNILYLNPRTGNAESSGSLYIGKDAKFFSSVILGSTLADSVFVHARLTTLLNFNATNSTLLGDRDEKNVTIYGDMTISSNNHSNMLSIMASNGDVSTICDLRIEREATFRRNVSIGVRGKSGLLHAFSNATTAHILSAKVPSFFYGPVSIKSSLEVDGSSILEAMMGEECTLHGDVGVGPHAEDFIVNHVSGNVDVGGMLEVEQKVLLRNSVTLGQGKRHQINVKGDTKLRSTLTANSQLSVGQDFSVDGDTAIMGDVKISNDQTVFGDVYLGDNPERLTVVHGTLEVTRLDGAGSLMSVNTSNGNTAVAGRLTIQGTTHLDGATVVDSTAVVNGAAVLESDLDVDMNVDVTKAVRSRRGVTVEQQMSVSGNLTAQAAVTLGSAELDCLVLPCSVEIWGQLFVMPESSATAPLLSVTEVGVIVAEQLLVRGDSNFEDDLDIGAADGATLTILAATTTKSSLTAQQELLVRGTAVIQGQTHFHTDTEVRGDTTLGSEGMSTDEPTVTVNGKLTISDLTQPRMQVSEASGLVEIWADVQVMGNVEIDGRINTPKFVVSNLLVDTIDENTDSEGVLIEGVLVRDGAIEFARVDHMQELLPTRGVTLENSNCKGGAMVLTSPCEPCEFFARKELDALTLSK